VRVSKENREEGSSRERKYSKERKGSNGGMRQKQKVRKIECKGVNVRYGDWIG